MENETIETLRQGNKEAQDRMYVAIVFLDALNKSCKAFRNGLGSASSTSPNALEFPFDAFKAFVNKLCQACDSERGGNTITSISVVQGESGPLYLLASNRRSRGELEETRSFLYSLLSVARISGPRKTKPVMKLVQSKIVLFCRPRINAYLKNLHMFLGECIEDCRRTGDSMSSQMMNDLGTIRAAFPADTGDAKNDEAKFAKDCEKLLSIIHDRTPTLNDGIMNKCQDGQATESDRWCELRHYLFRLYSYREAARIIVAAAAPTRWPALFQDFGVECIPSSERMPKPIAAADTADGMLRRLFSNDEHNLEACLGMARDLQRNFGFDKLIQDQIAKKSFRPIVHCEANVHNTLQTRGYTHHRDYWGGWKYIGASKPPCLLCQHYFNEHPDNVSIRGPSHQNLYPNWACPGDSDNLGALQLVIKARIMDGIREKLQNEALMLLHEKMPFGRKHDSNDSSARPRYLDHSIISSALSDIESMAASLSIQNDDLRVVVEDIGDDGYVTRSEDEDEGGVCVSDD